MANPNQIGAQPVQTNSGQSGDLPSYMQGWPSQGQSNGDWLTNAYQTYFGRTPDQQGFNYWFGQLNNGVPPSAIAESWRASPEAQVTGLYGQFLGRAPDQEGYAHYADMIGNQGYDAARNEVMNSVEARNYQLGDGYRDYARAATAGLNQMPYIFSDYSATVPGYRNVPKSPFEALFGSGSAGQDTINQQAGLLAKIFEDAPKKTDEPAPDTKDKVKKAEDEIADAVKNRFLGRVWNPR